MAMPINRRFPLAAPSSVDQLMAIAVAIEQQAALGYDRLASLVEARGEAELAATFRRLAALERRHQAGLEEWAGLSGPSDSQPIDFPLPETFSEEELAAGTLTPYRALAIAVRNEEQAFSLYAYLAAMADGLPAVRQRAEALAREELHHLAQLRTLRRQAFHARRGKGSSRPPVASTLDQLNALAAGLEQGAAKLCLAAVERLAAEGRSGAAAVLRRAGEASHQRAGKLAGGGPGQASRAAQAALARVGEPTAKEALSDCLRDSEEVLETYLTVAETAKDEGLLQQALGLAEAAMARLALVRQGMA